MGVAGWRFVNKTNNNGRMVVIAFLEAWPVFCSVTVAAGAFGCLGIFRRSPLEALRAEA